MRIDIITTDVKVKIVETDECRRFLEGKVGYITTPFGMTGSGLGIYGFATEDNSIICNLERNDKVEVI